MPGKPKRFDAVLRVRVHKKYHARLMKLAKDKGTFASELLRDMFVDAVERAEAIQAQKAAK